MILIAHRPLKTKHQTQFPGWREQAGFPFVNNVDCSNFCSPCWLSDFLAEKNTEHNQTFVTFNNPISSNEFFLPDPGAKQFVCLQLLQATGYDVCVYIVYKHPAISCGHRLGQSHTGTTRR